MLIAAVFSYFFAQLFGQHGANAGALLSGENARGQKNLPIKCKCYVLLHGCVSLNTIARILRAMLVIRHSVCTPLCRTEHIAHHPDQLQCAQIADAVEHPIRILACRQHTLVAQNRQMLRDVALGCADLLNDILHTDLLVAQDAQNFQAQRMGDRLDGLRCLLNIILSVNQFFCHHRFPVNLPSPAPSTAKSAKMCPRKIIIHLYSTSMNVTPVLLLILYGFGYREEADFNAILAARKPNWDALWRDYPHTLINASEKFVGLPSKQMGNSEVEIRVC